MLAVLQHCMFVPLQIIFHLVHAWTTLKSHQEQKIIVTSWHQGRLFFMLTDLYKSTILYLLSLIWQA